MKAYIESLKKFNEKELLSDTISHGKYEIYAPSGKPYPKPDIPCVYIMEAGASVLFFTRGRCSKCYGHDYVIGGDPCEPESVRYICKICIVRFFFANQSHKMAGHKLRVGSMGQVKELACTKHISYAAAAAASTL